MQIIYSSMQSFVMIKQNILLLKNFQQMFQNFSRPFQAGYLSIFNNQGQTIWFGLFFIINLC